MRREKTRRSSSSFEYLELSPPMRRRRRDEKVQTNGRPINVDDNKQGAHNVHILQKDQPILSKERPKNTTQPVVPPAIHVEVVALKVQTKFSVPQFNIIEHMKKVKISMYMWDLLSIHGQKYLL